MAEMALGYGSEYQLLRFLGHHRNELEQCILKQTKINENSGYSMKWLDYPKDIKRKSLDSEYVGLGFLDKKIADKLSNNWQKYWPKNGPNWDSIIYCSPVNPSSKLVDKWIVVEAKAHLKELESSSKVEDEESKILIEKAFEETKKHFNIKSQNNWLKKYYQLANILAFINFMLNNGIQCSLLNIYFINGWNKNTSKNVTSIEMWKEKILDEYLYLGINHEAKKYISEIFVNC